MGTTKITSENKNLRNVKNNKNCIEGYLFYKTITSSNVSSEAQAKNIFVS